MLLIYTATQAGKGLVINRAIVLTLNGAAAKPPQNIPEEVNQ